MESFFHNTLSLTQWIVLAAVPPAILALYFLKLRRLPIEVPSTYLWAKSIEDLRVNSLWQRLRKSLLLLLQLLVVGLAILALLRPGWQGTELTGQRLIFLIDNSASMSATDAKGDQTRLTVAKEKVGGLIDQMDRGMTAMLIAFAGTPHVVQEFTDNPRLLREGVASIQPTAEPTDLTGALKLAGGLANPAQVTVQEGAPEVDVLPAESATLFLLSDGRFDDVKDFALGNLEPIYVPLGSTKTTNLAITVFETRRNEASPNLRQAFVQITNYGTEPAEAVVELLHNGRLLDAQRLSLLGQGETLVGGKAAGLSFPLGELSAGALEARLTDKSLRQSKDCLPIDNLAYAVLNEDQGGRVLFVTPGNIAVEQALVTVRAGRLSEVEVVSTEVLASKQHQRDAAAGAFDLVIYDRCLPETMPQANTLFVGQLPPTTAWDKDDSISVIAPQIIDWNRAHPLLAHIELGNFDIVESWVLPRPAGGATLIDAAEGPIAVIAPRDGYEDVVLGFAILVEEEGRLQRNTDWINRHSFPTFWLNTLEYFVQDRVGGSRSHKPGSTIELRPRVATATELQIVSPSGDTSKLHRRGSEPFLYQATDQLGVYQAHEGGAETERFAVNLFDRTESDIRLRASAAEGQEDGVASLQIGNTLVTATAGAAPARKELWRWILLAALGVLLLEWYIYHRRVYV